MCVKPCEIVVMCSITNNYDTVSSIFPSGDFNVAIVILCEVQEIKAVVLDVAFTGGISLFLNRIIQVENIFVTPSPMRFGQITVGFFCTKSAAYLGTFAFPACNVDPPPVGDVSRPDTWCTWVGFPTPGECEVFSSNTKYTLCTILLRAKFNFIHHFIFQGNNVL